MERKGTIFAQLCLVFLVCDASGAPPPFHFFNLHCKIDKETQKLECIVDVLNFASKNAKDFDLTNIDPSNKWIFCGTSKIDSENKLVENTPPAGVKCFVNRACLSVHRTALVMAAHKRHSLRHFIAKTGQFSEKYRFTVDGPLKRDGIFSMAQDISLIPGSPDQFKPTEMRLTADMLTAVGFLAVQLGGELGQMQTHKPEKRKYYVGLSGGGWRALSAAMGLFRGLSENGALPMVDMFSSVSGGTWFLTKLSFDEEFAKKVLESKVPISSIVLWWFEKKYFPAFKHVERSDERMSELATMLSTLAKGPISLVLGNGIEAAERFNYNWTKFIEKAVVGQQIADKVLATAKLAETTGGKFKPSVLLAFNWNQMHQWEDRVSRWFLQDKTAGKPSQYPVYTSAQFKRKPDGTGDVSVRAIGKNLKDKFSICEIKDKKAKFKDGSAKCELEFDFEGLTVGQVASASSAAVGGATVPSWLRNLVEATRHAIGTAKGGPTKSALCKYGIPYAWKKTIAPPACAGTTAFDKIMELLNCKDSKTPLQVAEDWSDFLVKMAVQMQVKNSKNEDKKKIHMAIDAGYTDNYGVSTILDTYLQDQTAKHAQILVLVHSGLGQPEIEKYFELGVDHRLGGQICASTVAKGPEAQAAHKFTMESHEQTFKQIGAEFEKQDFEDKRYCAMRFAGTQFFKGAPPLHHRFDSDYVPAHVTYAFKENVEIFRNDNYYHWPGKTKRADVLFLNMNAPAKMDSMPTDGSEIFVGVASVAYHAMTELAQKFPAFFKNKKSPSRFKGNSQSPLSP